MQPVPYEYLFGVDVAMQKLRPGAHFQIEGNRFTIWNDPNGTEPPTWEEVQAQMEADQKRYEEYVANGIQLGNQ